MTRSHLLRQTTMSLVQDAAQNGIPLAEIPYTIFIDSASCRPRSKSEDTLLHLDLAALRQKSPRTEDDVGPGDAIARMVAQAVTQIMGQHFAPMIKRMETTIGGLETKLDRVNAELELLKREQGVRRDHSRPRIHEPYASSPPCFDDSFPTPHHLPNTSFDFESHRYSSPLLAIFLNFTVINNDLTHFPRADNDYNILQDNEEDDIDLGDDFLQRNSHRNFESVHRNSRFCFFVMMSTS